MIKYVFRYLTRQKIFTCINVLGLALSLACCIMLTRYLHREWTVDSNVIDGATVGEVICQENSSHAIVWHLDGIRQIVDDFAIESCYYCPMDNVDVTIDTITQFANVLMVDSTYLHFFDLPLVGDRHALSRPDGAYISRPLAKQWFGDESPLGKTISLYNIPLTIAGIFDYPACKQSIVTDLYVPYLAKDHYFNHAVKVGSRWIRLASPGDADKLNRALEDAEEGFRFYNCTDSYIYHSERAEFFDLKMEHPMFPRCNSNAIQILGGVDILIILVGIFNFVNLYMVLIRRRRREWGIRKVFGQKPLGLFYQVWCENTLQVLAALFVAWLLVELSKEYINQMLDYDFSYSLFDLRLTLFLLGIIPLLSALYPFTQYFRLTSTVSLQSKGDNNESIRMRLVFLATQYLLTLCILISAIWFNNHLTMLLDHSGQLKGDNVYIADLNHYNDNIMDDQNAYKIFGLWNEILECPMIEMLDTKGGAHPVSFGTRYTDISASEDKKETMVHMDCSRSMFRMFDIPIVMGDLEWDQDQPSDYYFILLNETAFRLLGFKSLDEAYIYNTPYDVMDTEPSITGYSYTNEDTGESVYKQWGTKSNPVKVKAVVKDYYCGHASAGVKPMVFACNTAMDNSSLYIGASYTLRPKPGKAQEMIDFLRKTEKKYFGTENILCHTFQDELDSFYQEDKRLAQICSLFAFIAILICCLGLFGLSLFDIRQRYREIAIRKAHGAHRKDLYLLLGKKYFYLLLFTFALSIPVTYLLIHRYTESFIESAPLTPIIYIEALGIVVLITVLTLIYQLEKAARVNVASVVKTE